jgi:hypothetical protein
LERSLTAAKTECNSLRTANALLSTENILQRQLIPKFGQFDKVRCRFPLLSHHVELLLRSASIRTPRCSPKMNPFYVLAGSMGEAIYELLIATLPFHHGAKSSDIEQSARKCSVCTRSTFLYPDRVFVPLPVSIRPSHQINVSASQ